MTCDVTDRVTCDVDAPNLKNHEKVQLLQVDYKPPARAMEQLTSSLAPPRAATKQAAQGSSQDAAGSVTKRFAIISYTSD